jgi:hypothetical protein
MGGGGLRTNLATFMRDRRELDQDKEPGPFLTISRQYGCHGYFLGLLLVDVLNSNEPGERNPWKVLNRDIINQVSEETDMASEVVARLRMERPRMLVEFFRNFSSKRSPGAYEVRNRIGNIMRALAYEGHYILVGMGGAGATSEIPNGLRIRLEASKEWRVARVVESEGLSPVEARLALQKQDKVREYLRQVYAVRYPREPVFDITYDCGSLTLAQITQHIVQAMKLKKMI